MQHSEWIEKHHEKICPNGLVLDLACGAGRNSVFLLGKGFRVLAVDIDVLKLQEFQRHKNLLLIQADLEGGLWPFAEKVFDAIVVTNYLWRPLFPKIAFSLKTEGVVLYETFASGNEKYGRPKNPDFLLQPGELPKQFDGFSVLDYYHGEVKTPKPAVKQAIAAKRVV
ncbi:class I SAM-dependent methyltransferase [Sneathiella glossodoripedis]|uniref:class I SAM-dependent methyltransferase n=1 Tax=Sneathiella glossodoripedis TaxID=418853 RepID=UPI0004716889|nr:class I SAM-dependent methyltransferase [Sneathiella glossodoripedis]